MANEIRTGVRTLNLSASQLKKITSRQGAEWSNELINDYLTILENFIRIANATDDIIEQVDDNTAAIIVNAEAIQVNVDNILINKGAIALVAQNLEDHENDNVVHGVAGVVVGTEDYPSEVVGGAVKRSELVNDVSLSTSPIVTADLTTAPEDYTQTYTQLQTGLINEEKGKINSLLVDLTAVKDAFNDLLAKAKAAEQMTS